MANSAPETNEVRAVLDLFLSIRTGISVRDVKPGQVAVGTCDRSTYAELGYGIVRLLWIVHFGDRAVISVHPAALAEVGRLAWRKTPEEVMGDEFAGACAASLRSALGEPDLQAGAPAIKLYHPGGAARPAAAGTLRPLTPADRVAWPGPRAIGLLAADHPCALRGEAFGLFVEGVLVGDVMTHDPSVADMAHLVAEDGIEVAEGYRGKGYGKALLAHWTCEMQARGRACLHGTSLTNDASIALARSVGYVEYARHRSVTFAPPEKA